MLNVQFTMWGLFHSLICIILSYQFEGGVEYFNTIVVQPHRKLVTNQGRGFHISCRYQTRDKTISNDVDVR